MSDKTYQREFLYDSIQDTVSTVRAIDTKLHIVLGIFVLPFAFADKLVDATCYWCSRWDWNSLCALQWWTTVAACVTLALWGLGLLFSLGGILALANPEKAVERKDKTLQGSFYFVGKLKGWWRKKLDRSLEEHMAALPANEGAVLRELAFEQMKLGFIRDVKMTRHRRAAVLAIIWAIVAGVTVLLYHLSIGARAVHARMYSLPIE